MRRLLGWVLRGRRAERAPRDAGQLVIEGATDRLRAALAAGVRVEVRRRRKGAGA